MTNHLCYDRIASVKGVDEEDVSQKTPLERQRLVKAVGVGLMFVASELGGRKPFCVSRTSP